MDFNKLDKKVSSSNFYKFTQKHRKFILIIQGLFIIGLLIAMNIYVYQDHFLKKQIAKNCGYVNSKYKCICEQHYVDNWEELRDGIYNINITESNNDKLVR